MQVECFDCGVAVEIGDTDTVEDRFVAHGRESHEWPYPEEAIRNYARNFADATERLTGSPDRLTDVREATVHPVTADRVDDWLRFFDHDGFVGNPSWASCYCLEPHDPPSPEMPERAWRDTRATMIERLRTGGTYGYLAYVEEKTAGWVNASHRADYRLYKDVDPEGPTPSSVIAVSCYVVAPPYRRHGIASALLDRVIADAPARGASWIEAYPHNNPEGMEPEHQFRGFRSMYDTRGFEPVEEHERYTVMRRPAS